MNARKAHKIWLQYLRVQKQEPIAKDASGRKRQLKADMLARRAFEKAKSWFIRSSRRNGTDNYIKDGHWTENDKNTYARLRRRGR